MELEIGKRLRFYGIDEDGTLLSPSQLPHLTWEDLQTRKKLEEAIEKEKTGGLTTKGAIKRYIEHVSFTYLNRLAALRAMEVRNLIDETIIRRSDFGGRSLRERRIVESNPELKPDQALRECLLEAFREVGQQIKVLFDLENEYSLVFPENAALREVIKQFTEQVTEEDWKVDEIIGWIYQYFNEEARQQYRKAKRRPTPDDIPIISQFYTPHWIVKALADNTLGRLWLEIHPTSRIGSFCTYLKVASRKNETPIKRVKDIKILDPACGSGHFLVYAFDILYLMYQEDEPETPVAEIPSLILENNIFGVDIDLRAVQLAALSLFLKAKTFNRQLKIRKMNIVCADIRLLNGERRAEFLNRFKDDAALQRIFDKLFRNLGTTFEVGSLLKVRQPFEDLLNERKAFPKENQSQFSFAVRGQTNLSKKGLAGQASFLGKSEIDSNDSFLGIATPRQRTIEEMMEEVIKFEQEALEIKDIGRLLFATEAEKSVGLLGLLSQRYDIVLMNPPHGRMPPEAKKYARKYYPRTHHDFYGSFLEQAVDLIEPHGLIGALTGRALLITKSFQKMREEIFQEEALPDIILDLGFKTMEEAHARYAALTLSRPMAKSLMDSKNHKIAFFNLGPYEFDEKRIVFEDCLRAYPFSKTVYEVSIGELSEVPGTPYSYWAPSVLRGLFSRFPPLDRDLLKDKKAPKIADVKQGLATADKLRFNRFWWEVPKGQIASNREETFAGKKWVPFAEEFYLFYFYADLPVVLNWANDGEEIRNFRNAVIRSESFYFEPGLTWSSVLQRTQLASLWGIQRLPFRILPEGSVFSHIAQGVIADMKIAWPLLAICCSRLIFAVSRLLALENKQGTAATAALPIAYQPADIERNASILASLAKEAYDLMAEWSTGDETSTLFFKPWLLQVLSSYDPPAKPLTQHPFANRFEWSNWQTAQEIRQTKGSLSSKIEDLSGLLSKRQNVMRERLETIQNQIDEEVYRAYGVTETDRVLIQHELDLQKGDNSERKNSKETETQSDATAVFRTISIDEHVKRLLSYYARRIIEADEDGIIPLNEAFTNNLAAKIRQEIGADFGTENLVRIEQELEKLLGKPLSTWLHDDFFDFHISLYRRRPIFWQLTSDNFGRFHGQASLFSCFLYYHKLTKDTLLKVQSVYLSKVRERFLTEKEYLSRELAKASDHTENETNLKREYAQVSEKLIALDKFSSALTELTRPRSKRSQPNDSTWISKKIAEVRDAGWNPVIDYGVRVNIEPLKELGILSKAAEKVR